MEKLKILIIEDSKYDLELILRELNKSRINFESIHLSEFEEVKKQISGHPPDIIFSDFQLYSFTGAEVLNYRNLHAPHTPFIIITGALNEEKAVEIIKAGADDYILKDNLSRLIPSMFSEIEKMNLNKQKILAEKKLKESEEKFSKIFQFSPIPGAIINFESGLIMDVNESFCEFSGFADNEIIGNYIFDFGFVESGRYKKEILDRLEAYNHIKNYEIQVRTKRDEVKYVLTNFLKITLDNVKYIIVNLVDITPMKRVEQELSNAKKHAEEMNKLKTTFLTNLSHEFRTPLNGILGFSDMLVAELNSSEHKSYAEAIQISGRRLLDTFNDLIDLSVIESGKVQLKREAVNLVNVTRKVFARFRENVTKELDLILDIKSENLICTMDIPAYKKIIYKLLDNAVKFTHKGFVKLSLDKIFENGNQSIVVKVADTGIGISQDDLEIVFERFRQSSEGLKRNYEGTGIGLSIAKKFIELLGGKISVESNVGEGTTFTVLFPCLLNPSLNIISRDRIIKYNVEANHNESAWEKFKKKERTILVVEDNDVDSYYIHKLLAPYFKVKRVKDSMKAHNIYSAEKFDLIFLDIKFTTGIDGVEVLKGIRENEVNTGTPVIASTALAMAGDRENILCEGFNDYLQKPFDKKALYKILSKHFVEE